MTLHSFIHHLKAFFWGEMVIGTQEEKKRLAKKYIHVHYFHSQRMFLFLSSDSLRMSYSIFYTVIFKIIS